MPLEKMPEGIGASSPKTSFGRYLERRKAKQPQQSAAPQSGPLGAVGGAVPQPQQPAVMPQRIGAIPPRGNQGVSANAGAYQGLPLGLPSMPTMPAREPNPQAQSQAQGYYNAMPQGAASAVSQQPIGGNNAMGGMFGGARGATPDQYRLKASDPAMFMGLQTRDQDAARIAAAQPPAPGTPAPGTPPAAGTPAAPAPGTPSQTLAGDIKPNTAPFQNVQQNRLNALRMLSAYRDNRFGTPQAAPQQPIPSAPTQPAPEAKPNPNALTPEQQANIDASLAYLGDGSWFMH